MYIFTSLLLLVAAALLLRFVSQHAERLEFKKHSPLWIAIIWAVSVGATLLFKQYYELPVVVYILFSTGIATIIYLVVADIDVSGALLFSISNTLVLLAVMFHFGMLGERLEKTVTSGDVQLVADGVCQCAANQACLDKILPKMEKMMLESQALLGNDAIIAANAIARAHHCMEDNPVKPERETMVTFLDDWEKERGNAKSSSEPLPDQKKVLPLLPPKASGVVPSGVVTASIDKKPKAVETVQQTDFQTITASTLKQYQGDILRLTKANGKVLNGWLIADEGSKIILKQKLSGGYVHMPIVKASISLFEVKPKDVTR